MIPAEPARDEARFNRHGFPSRRTRLALLFIGLLFVAQGLGKAVDPTGYMAALDGFHVQRGVMVSPLMLGGLALSWTALELFMGGAILYGALSRTPDKRVTMAGLAVAIGLSCAYLALSTGAIASRLSIQNATWFGVYLPQRLSWRVLAEQALVLATVVWQLRVVRGWKERARMTTRAEDSSMRRPTSSMREPALSTP